MNQLQCNQCFIFITCEFYLATCSLAGQPTCTVRSGLASESQSVFIYTIKTSGLFIVNLPSEKEGTDEFMWENEINKWNLSCMPVVCVAHYKLQRDASYLNESVKCSWVPQWGSSYWKPVAIWLHSWHFYHSHATKALLQGQMCKIKETPTSPEML